MRVLFFIGLWAAAMVLAAPPASVWGQEFTLTGDIELLATLQVADEGREVAVSGNWAFVAAGAEGLLAVDLREPRAPVVQGAAPNIGTAVDVVARALDEIYVLAKDVPRAGEGTFLQGLFVLQWNARLHRLDERGFAALEDSNGAGTSLDLQYPLVFVTAPFGTSAKLIPVDVSEPAGLTVQPFENLPFPAVDSVRSDRWPFMFFVAAGDQGLGIYEALHDPPRVLDGPWLVQDTPGNASRLELRDMRCYLSDGSGGLRIVDVGNPNQPMELGAYELSGYGEAQSLELAFPRVYLANGYGGLLVIDVSSSASPVLMAAVEPEKPDPGYNVQAVAFEDRDDLIVFLTGQGFLSVAQYPKRLPTPTPDVDLNDDGRVDSLDAFLFGRQWQMHGPTPTPAPKPE